MYGCYIKFIFRENDDEYMDFGEPDEAFMFPDEEAEDHVGQV